MSRIYVAVNSVLFCKTICSGCTYFMNSFKMNQLCIWRNLTCSVFHIMCFSLNPYSLEGVLDENFD